MRTWGRRWWWIPVVVLLAAGGVAWGLQREAQRPVASRIEVAPSYRRSLSFTLGKFRVDWDGRAGSFTVWNSEMPGHLVWASPAGEAFFFGAYGQMTSSDNIGYFTLHRRLLETFARQTVDQIRSTADGRLVFAGELRARDGKSVRYTFTLAALAPDRLQYDGRAQGDGINRLYLNWRTRPSDHFYGFGVQYSTFDMKGKLVPILVQEHGIGRGVQPLTFLVDLTHGAGGRWYNTYAPVPHFLSSSMQSLYSENSEYQTFNFTDPRMGQLEVDASHIQGFIFAGTTPASLVKSYTAVVGRMRPLPDWTQQGFIFGTEGGTALVTSRLDALLSAGVPVTGLWIQDWVGQRTTGFGQQLVWNWVLNRRQYPGWEAFVRDLRQKGIRLLGYVNPFLTDVSKFPGMTNLYAVAKAKGYFVKGPDGKPVVFQYPNFTACLIDFTNPQARAWYEQVMERELVANGFSGWMADFGEELPLDARLADGETGAAVHNLYPVLWAQVNREVMDRSGLAEQGLFFMRSGFSTSPAVTSDFWLGDQLQSWDAENGLASSITALLSAGLSGFSLESSDIGGYTAITQFPFHYARDEELLMRWMELDAFTTLFRSHEGNQPGKAVQVYSNPRVIAQLRRFAILFRDLAPYRERLMQEAAATGAPVDRPMFYEYPGDPNTYAITYQQFMLGPDVLVAPVTTPHTTSVRVYLPRGRWVHVWSGRVYDIAAGRYVEVAAPIGEPAVFYREGAPVGALFAKALADIRAAEGGR